MAYIRRSQFGRTGAKNKYGRPLPQFRDKPQHTWPNPYIPLRGRRKGRDWHIKATITNSFEPDTTLPPPKGGYPKGNIKTPRTTTNSRRG